MSPPEPEPAQEPQAEPTSTGSTSRNRDSPVRPIVLAVVLIAAGIGIFFVYPPMGILVLVAGFCAMVWTVIRSNRQAKAGQPIGTNEKLRVFVVALGSAFLVLIASAIAFIATCFPIGLLGFDEGGAGKFAGLPIFGIASGVGTIAALLAGAAMARYLIKEHRTQTSAKPLKKRRW